MDGGALKRCKATFAIDLHPSHSASALTGIREQLDAWLLRWNHDLGGIMLSYANLHVQSSQARIHPYFPFFHVDVTADVDLFCPASGHTLSGKVSKIGADYVGLLVLGVLNAAIGRQNIRSDLVYMPLANHWASQKHPEHVIEEGSEVIFTVLTVQNEGDFFSLTGKLLSRSTGAKAYVGAFALEEHRKTKKRRMTEPAPRSNAQPGEAHLLQSASGEHHQQRIDLPLQPPTAARPHVSSQQELGADSAAGLSEGISLTEKKRKKRRKTEGDLQSMQQADAPAIRGAAVGTKTEPSAPDSHAPAQTLAAGPAMDVPVKSESEAAEGKMSRKKRKKLKLSAPDLSLSTPVSVKAEPGADSEGPLHSGHVASAPMQGADLSGLSKKQLKKLGLSAPDSAAATPLPIKAEPGAHSADLQLPDHVASAPMQGADLSGLSKKQRKKLGLSAPDLAAATPVPVKAEPDPGSAGPQHPDHSASAAMQGADLSGLSKKQRKKLRMSMPDSAVLARASSDPGLDWGPHTLTGHSQGGPQSMPAGQDSAVTGNGAVVKEEGGSGGSKKRKQNGQHVSAVEQVKTEPVLSNGHDVDRHASGLPGSSKKKHKKDKHSD